MDTLANIRDTSEFVINPVHRARAEAMNLTSTETQQTDTFELLRPSRPAT